MASMAAGVRNSADVAGAPFAVAFGAALDAPFEVPVATEFSVEPFEAGEFPDVPDAGGRFGGNDGGANGTLPVPLADDRKSLWGIMRGAHGAGAPVLFDGFRGSGVRVSEVTGGGFVPVLDGSGLPVSVTGLDAAGATFGGGALTRFDVVGTAVGAGDGFVVAGFAGGDKGAVAVGTGVFVGGALGGSVFEGAVFGCSAFAGGTLGFAAGAVPFGSA